MEFGFEVAGLQGSRTSVWDAARLVQLSSVEFQKLHNVLEVFGKRSAVAQGLRAPITDIWRLRSSDQRLYLQTAASAAGSCTLLGGLKVGGKKLFIHRANGAIVEIEPLCVLDFYVYEEYQRQGVGKALFENMLAAEQAQPEQLAYDRPSPKLLSFLKKHYTLCSFVPQNNNFVVFEQYFQSYQPPAMSGSKRLHSTQRSNSGNGQTSSSPIPFLLGSMGNGRQIVHAIGTAAAAQLDEAACQQWVPTSLRPPTPSLQHSVQLQPAWIASSLGSPACAAAAASLGSSLGGPGCSAAGVPTHRPDRQHAFPFSQQQLQVPQEVQYARGAGFKSLDRGQGVRSAGGPDSACTFKGYEQALLGAAANPVLPLLPGSTLPLRDCLDQFSSSMGNNNSRQQQVQQQQQQHMPASMSPPWACCADAYSSNTNSGSRGSASGQAVGYQTNRPPAGKPAYSLTTPYSSWEPQPGALLPACTTDTDHVSLRRQEEQQAQQRVQQQQERWQAMGAGPPGHLLAAPSSSYAVPTAGMAEVMGSSLQQQQQHPPSSILSWDGLPVSYLKQPKQQLLSGGGNGSIHSAANISSPYQQHPRQPGQLVGSRGSNQGSRASSGGAMGQGGLESWESAKSAAASHRSGSGAASCLRMV